MRRVTRGELRGALRSAGLDEHQVPAAALAVEDIVAHAEDDLLRELSAFLFVRQCPTTVPGSGRCQKDEHHPGSHGGVGLEWMPRTFEDFLELRHQKALRRAGRGRGETDIVGTLLWPQDAAESRTAANRATDEALELLASPSGRTHGFDELGKGRVRLGFETGEIEVGPGQRIVRYEDGTVLVRD